MVHFLRALTGKSFFRRPVVAEESSSSPSSELLVGVEAGSLLVLVALCEELDSWVEDGAFVDVAFLVVLSALAVEVGRAEKVDSAVLVGTSVGSAADSETATLVGSCEAAEWVLQVLL